MVNQNDTASGDNNKIDSSNILNIKKRSSQIDGLSTDGEDNFKITEMLQHIDNSILELNKYNPEGRQILDRLNFNPNAKYSKKRFQQAQKELSLMKEKKKKRKRKQKFNRDTSMKKHNYKINHVD